MSLARFISEHRGAVTYDLMTRTGHDLSDVGRTLSWGALRYFIENIGADSAIAREINPDVAVWSTTVKTNAILADIYDLLAAINANLIAMGSHKRPRRPKDYPRPGHKQDNEKRFGRGAMPVDELRKWISEKQSGRND